MMQMKRLIGELAEGMCEVAWPTRCVACDTLGTLLCARCRSLLIPIDQAGACPRCGAPFGRLVCTECTTCLRRDEEGALSCGEGESGPEGFLDCLDALRSYGMLEWPLDRMVRAYKDAGERRLGTSLGEALAHAAQEGFGSRLEEVGGVVFVPATPQAFARRGFDHMELVARAACASLGLPLLDVLARRTPLDQRGLSRQGREANALGSFAVTRSLEGVSVLLVDDVVTTGATLASAARALRARGATCVLGATVARAWAS